MNKMRSFAIRCLTNRLGRGYIEGKISKQMFDLKHKILRLMIELDYIEKLRN